MTLIPVTNREHQQIVEQIKKLAYDSTRLEIYIESTIEELVDRGNDSYIVREYLRNLESEICD